MITKKTTKTHKTKNSNASKDSEVIDFMGETEPLSEDSSSSKMTPWKFIAAFLLLFVVVFATTFFMIQKDANTTDSYTFNGFKFVQAPSGNEVLWVTQISVRGQLYNIPFYYHPSAVLDVEFEEGLADAIVDATIQPDIVYITLDPDSGSKPVVAAVEISRIFGTKYNLLNLPVQSALSRPVEGVETNVITCDDAKDGVLVIQFLLGEKNAVYNQNNCVLVEYVSVEESIRVADRFAYELLKIM